MQLTKAQKAELLEMFAAVDVKKLQIDIDNENHTKWFRFGSYNGLQIATEIVKMIKEKPRATAKKNTDGITS
jgi:alpha-galactosidase/6-phospho-beta-glucosidase family protein